MLMRGYAGTPLNYKGRCTPGLRFSLLLYRETRENSISFQRVNGSGAEGKLSAS